MPPADTDNAAQQSHPVQSFQREFQFIGAQDKSARKKSRVHVTKEFYRERRWNQIHSHKVNETHRSESKTPSKPDFVVSVTKLDGECKEKDARASKFEANAQRFPQHNRKSSHCPNKLASPSIYSLLGAGRTDPFQSYPIEATEDIHHLVDHYHFVIPSLLHKQWGRHITHPMPIMDLFEVYRQDPATFLGMLHHAAHHLAKMRGKELESQQVIAYKYRTLKILNERLASTTGPYDDHTIVAVGLLANAERVWGDKQIARLHWGATKRMILDRGGFPAFKDNHLVHTKLIWSFIALSGAWPIGSPAYIDNFADTVAEDPKSPNAAPRSAFAKSCDEFVSFFTTRRANALRALPTSEADRAHHKKFPLRSTSFRPGTRMFNVLAAVNTSYSFPERRRAVDNCRLACLIYLNSVLLEYGDFSSKTEKFFQIFSGFIEDDDLDCTLSAEHLFWALVRGIEPYPAHERIWKVSRMIGVIKRADQQTWLEVEEALRMFLIMPEDGTKLILRIAAWDTERFRKEILSFPDIESEYSPGQLPLPPEMKRKSRSLGSADDIDFLPETRDVQWFPSSIAAAESGVEPHKLYIDVSANETGPSKVLESTTPPEKSATLTIRPGQNHVCGEACEICKLKPANF